MSRPKVNKVPPDGGYGWVVTFAYALNNVSYLLPTYSFSVISVRHILHTIMLVYTSVFSLRPLFVLLSAFLLKSL